MKEENTDVESKSTEPLESYATTTEQNGAPVDMEVHNETNEDEYVACLTLETNDFL